MYHKIARILERYRSAPVQIRASFWFLACSFLTKALSAVTAPIFTRLLTKDQYGQFSVFLSWQYVLGVFITLQLFYGVYTTGLVRFSDRRGEFVSAMEGLVLALVSAWGVIFFVFRAPLSRLLSLTPLQMACLLLVLWTGAVYDFWAAEQRTEYHYKGLVAVTLLGVAVSPAVQIALVLHAEDKVTARIIGLALSQLAVCAWMFFAHVRRCGRLFSRPFWIYALKFNIPLIPHYLAQNVLSSSDRIMIERMVSADAAGLYSLACSVAAVMNLFSSALIQSLSPWIYEKIKRREEDQIQRTLAASTAVMAAAVLALIVLAPEVVRVFAPASYYEAVRAIPPVAMGAYFTYLYNIFSHYEFYYQKTSFISLATIAAAVLNLGLNFIFIPLFGYVAAGYTTLICFIAYAAGHDLVMRRIADRYLDGHPILPARTVLTISGVLLAGGSLSGALYAHPVVRYAVLGAGALSAYLCRRPIAAFARDLASVRRSDGTGEGS